MLQTVVNGISDCAGRDVAAVSTSLSRLVARLPTPGCGQIAGYSFWARDHDCVAMTPSLIVCTARSRAGSRLSLTASLSLPLSQIQCAVSSREALDRHQSTSTEMNYVRTVYEHFAYGHVNPNSPPGRSVLVSVLGCWDIEITWLTSSGFRGELLLPVRTILGGSCSSGMQTSAAWTADLKGFRVKKRLNERMTD